MATTDTAKTPQRRKPAASKQTAAKRKPRTTAKTTAKPRTRASQAQQLVERAVLIPVGAALETRDRVGALVATTRSRSALEQRLDRFERRGGSARRRLEREVRKTRKSLDANVESVANVVQNGVSTGIKLVNRVQDRLPKVA